MSRRIDEYSPETVHVNINYSDNVVLCNLVRSLGGTARMLDAIKDQVVVTPVKLKTMKSGDTEIILGFDAPDHIRLDRVPR